MTFTERELFIVKSIARGRSGAQIAQELGVSNSSVKNSVNVLRMKLAKDAPSMREIPARFREMTGQDPLEL